MQKALLGMALVLALTRPAFADAVPMPPPTRPEWNDPPAPLPEPPPDDGAFRWLLLGGSAVLAATVAMRRRRTGERAVLS